MPYLGNSHIAGDQINNFKVLDDISSHTSTFDGSASGVVSISDNTIRIPEHRFVQGQRVTYNNGGGGNIGNLSSGTAYYIIKDTNNTIKLATSLSNANNSTAINLSVLGSGSSHTLNVAFDGVNTKFKITHNGGTSGRINNATQLSLAINNVIQRPNQNAITFTEGFAIEDQHKIVFKVAPVSSDIFWGSILANTLPTFDITDNKIDNFTGDGSTTEFNLSNIPASNKSIMVTINGVLQHPSDGSTSRSYTLLANILQFTAAPGNGDEIQVRHIGFAGASTSDVTGFYGRTGNVVLTSNDHITTGNINAGIVTATTFVGNLTGNVSGNLTVGGVLTYEDVTNVDSIGIITARSGFKVLAGGANVVGVITARTNVHLEDYIHHLGDLTTKIGFPAANSVTLEAGGAARVRIINNQTKIGPDADSATASTNYEFQISGYSTGNCFALSLKHGTSGVGKNLRQAFFFTNDGNTPVDLANIRATCTANGAGSESGNLAFYTKNSGTSGERLRIQADGDVSFGDETIGRAQIKHVSGNQSDVNSGGFPQYAFVGNEGTGMRRVSSNVLAFDTTGAQRVLITSTGDVAINRSTPLNTAKFSLTKDPDQQGIAVQLMQSSGITTSLAAYNSSGTNIFDLAHDTDSTPDLLFKLKHSSDALPVEKLRIASDGMITLGNPTNTVLKAEVCNSVSGHYFVSQCDDNNNGFEIYQQHGSTASRNTLAVYANLGTSGAKKEQFIVRGDGNVGIATDISGGGGVYGRLSVVIPSQTGGSALQVMNSAVGSGDGSLTNIVLRSVNNLGTHWAGAEYRAQEHIFATQSTERLRIDLSGAAILKNTAAALPRSDFFGSLKPISQIASTWNAYHSLTRHDAGSSYGPYLMLAKNRNDAYNSNGAVQDNDELGNIAFLGNDGTAFREGARIRGEVDGTPGSSQVPSAITFATNAGSGVEERLRITADGEMGVNTDAPVEKLGISGNMRFVNPNGTTSRITALPSGSYSTGTSGGSAICFQRIADGGGGSDEIFFETHWQGNRHGESCRINKFGNLAFPSGQGIDFSATSDAPISGSSMDNELLDDYEEGSFTPVYYFGGTTSGVTQPSGNKLGRYTKIGNRVLFNLWITGTTDTSVSGTFQIGGLPYATASGGAQYAAFSSWVYAGFTNAYQIIFRSNPAADRIEVQRAGASVYASEMGGTANYMIAGHYITN